ncbi:hypothetical protein [Paraburkholderia pallida]|uniref:Uncharacterized protein n=1 Tax=Paraburkholderia pallida TaxID=2547399 RepID=A0A4P7DAX0_9BURK|nr:hypothetical protein [Paraburkholderia pallida]QBR04295.1 hypothetical protein E1956_45095 [Paraburkholderia pallida]
MDEETKAELLAFLVVGQLVALARNGDWLRTDHMIESSWIWLSSNSARCDWLTRARLVAAARELAPQVRHWPFPKDETSLLRLSNLQSGWFLDYRTEIVQRLHAFCAEYLERHITG